MKTEIVFNLNVSHGTMYYIWDVYRKDSNLYIGKIRFTITINQYVFAPNGPLIVFDSDTLTQIAKFLDTQNGVR